jgi:site-specific recombinase XerD
MSDLLDLDELLESWCRQLRGHRKSKQTVRSYRLGVTAFLRFCDDAGLPRAITKANVLAWLDAQHAQQAASVRLRLTALKLFARWLAAEEDLDMDSVLLIKPPKMVQADVPDLSEGELQRMLKVCDGPALNYKRDKAMLLLLAETGLRAAELLALNVDDVDLDGCVLRVRRGKGGKARRVRFSNATAAIVDRYVRARRRAVHCPAEGPLWVTRQSARLSYNGLVGALKARAADAEVIGFHVHRLRHTAAVRWLRAGGSETGLMAHAGWTDRTMINRYVKAASEQLAGEEFERLHLGLTEL